MGGTLSRPQDHWPTLFSHPFWGKYRYFLPCAVSACLLIVALFVLLFFLEETLSTERQPKLMSTTLGGISSVADIDREALPQKPVAVMPLRSLLIPSIVIPIANYALLAFLDISLMALLPLFFSTPTYLGGLGFTPSSIGLWLAMFGVVDGLFQAFFFAKIVDRFGPKRVFCSSVLCFAPTMIVFPIMSWLVHTRGAVDHAITVTLIGQ
ncbi:hypothetical protein AZE42_05274, partial [Rhizopogon vesiculosus]